MTALSVRVRWWRFRDWLKARFIPKPLFMDEDYRKLHTLALYNSEVARGIQHTDAWRKEMAALQRWFDTRRFNEQH